ncbi:hypothetical protein ILYODFUR_010087 [Ilyodon furcidens]|uniref:Uncharacterized protein n=1 Tax=Ilyodon furcidens TaxID=33524 RepID=A0ABV0TX60_9TELE
MKAGIVSKDNHALVSHFLSILHFALLLSGKVPNLIPSANQPASLSFICSPPQGKFLVVTCVEQEGTGPGHILRLSSTSLFSRQTVSERKWLDGSDLEVLSGGTGDQLPLTQFGYF